MKKETLRQNLPVIIAIALPLLLIIITAIVVMLPNFSPKPAYDFAYTQTSSRFYVPTSGGCEYYENYYSVEGGKIVKKPFEISVFDSKDEAEPCSGYPQKIKKDAPDIFLYDMKTGTSKQIENPDELAALNSKGQTISPDGYKVEKRFINNSGLFDVFGSGHGGVYASKKNKYVHLDISSDGSYYDSDFQFISWVDSIK